MFLEWRMSSNGYYLCPAGIKTVPSKLSQAPPVAVPGAQGGGKVGFNEFCGIWAPTDPLCPAGARQWLLTASSPWAVSAQPNPPRNRIRLILTAGTAFDMEAAGVTQNSGAVSNPSALLQQICSFPPKGHQQPGLISACTWLIINQSCKFVTIDMLSLNSQILMLFL